MTEVELTLADQRRESFESFFQAATGGFTPYEWQVNLALGGLPAVLPIPTGLGKTEGAVLGWAWRRLIAGCAEPLHLVYCLPMRTLVRQTVDRLRRYFDQLREAEIVDAQVYQLMGGAVDDQWASWPDKPWVLVGTQDQLLSRALNRGYAMSRFEWPVHFGLLNQNCRWIIDEVQLMGPGLWTTAQLDWMRRKRFPSISACETTWMSATVGNGFLATTDRKRDGIDVAPSFDSGLEQDANLELKRRRDARRPVDWLAVQTGKVAPPLERQVANAVARGHVAGTLSLVVCNTVKTAREVFLALNDACSEVPRVLLTSRFRRQDREAHEQQLLRFEDNRRALAKEHDSRGQIPEDPGLICVSTQVVEAGLDVSAHRLWSELPPWPSAIQRLGRLNRDGRDQGAQAQFWETPAESGRKQVTRVGPYEEEDIKRSKALVKVLAPLSAEHSFADAVEAVSRQHEKAVEQALHQKPEPMPRALDVHGLFSTERDVHGGFTDVSAFIRGVDADVDLTVFWREWANAEKGAPPPSGTALDGPPLVVEHEGCAVPFHQLAGVLKERKASAWVWNDDKDGDWERIWPGDLRPGMVVMLHRGTGGYDARLGWTGDASHKLDSAPSAGPGRALADDERTERGYWAPIEVHLGDARTEAERLCEALDIRVDHPVTPMLRKAVVWAARLHDLGKTYTRWQEDLPGREAISGGPWAKCPRVVAVDAASDSEAIRNAVKCLRGEAVSLGVQPRRRGRAAFVRLSWAVGKPLKREEVETLRGEPGVRWAGHVPFRPGMRHEAASVLAMWHRYREGGADYPALAVYLAAAHHGKVRTVLRSTTDSGEDVFGVRREPDRLEALGVQWPLDFTVAKDGAEGTWAEGEFLLTGHGWTGLVADLLGPWRPDDVSEAGVVPASEPRHLGPFVLAYLEALVRVADWRASQNPSHSITPGEVSRDD